MHWNELVGFAKLREPLNLYYKIILRCRAGQLIKGDLHAHFVNKDVHVSVGAE